MLGSKVSSWGKIIFVEKIVAMATCLPLRNFNLKRNKIIGSHMTCFDRRCMLRRQNPIQVLKNTYSCKEITMFTFLYILWMDPFLNAPEMLLIYVITLDLCYYTLNSF